MIDFRQLIDVGLHFGHQKSRWCPKMKPYIWGHRGGVHLIDISKTAQALQKAASFLESVAARGETILWVGTKKSAQTIVESIGKELHMPYVDYRWVGGTITNFHQVKKAVTKLLYLEDIITKSEGNIYTKKELVRFQKRADRLRRSVGGLKDLVMPVGAIVLIDVKKEQTALLEANVSKIPVVALVDTNSDPSGVDFVIPGNDDSAKGVQFVLEYLREAAKKGKLAKKTEQQAKAIVKKDDSAKKSDNSEAAKVVAPAEKKDDASKVEIKKAAAVKKESSKKPAKSE